MRHGRIEVVALCIVAGGYLSATLQSASALVYRRYLMSNTQSGHNSAQDDRIVRMILQAYSAGLISRERAIDAIKDRKVQP